MADTIPKVVELTDAQLLDVPPSKYRGLTDEQRVKIGRLLRQQAKQEKLANPNAKTVVSVSESKQVDFSELLDVIKSDIASKDPKVSLPATAAAAAWKDFGKYLLTKLEDNEHFVTIRLGQKGQGWMYVAENHRKVDGKTVMVDFESYDGKPVVKVL
jgi:hypothetical protein